MKVQISYALAASVAAMFLASPAIAASVAGTTSAIFVNPSPGTAVTTGIGTNSITEGSGSPPNQLTFTGTSFSSALETPFKVGSFYYYNGSVTDPADSVDLKLTLNFTTPALPAYVSTFTFNIDNTPNTGTPDQNADYLYFPSSYPTTTFQIGGVTYDVKLTGFGNIQGDGFLASNSSELHVRENSSATADLFGVVTTQTAVPEPATWAMMLVGMGMVGFSLRKRHLRMAVA